MDKTIEFLINKKDNGERLDVFLSKEIKEFTRSYIKKLIEKKQVALNKIINISPSKKKLSSITMLFVRSPLLLLLANRNIRHVRLSLSFDLLPSSSP